MKTQLTVFLAGLAGWMNRKQQDVINYLQAENEILKEQLDKKGGKLDLSNTQRRKLAKKGKKPPARFWKSSLINHSPYKTGYACNPKALTTKNA